MPELIKASSPADWRALNPENTLYLELEKGRVVIELGTGFRSATCGEYQDADTRRLFRWFSHCAFAGKLCRAMGGSG
jgi:hypothetical protein